MSLASNFSNCDKAQLVTPSHMASPAEASAQVWQRVGADE